MNHAEIKQVIVDPVTDAETYKNVFIVFAHGKELLNRIKKIGESMGATLYPVEEHPDKRRDSYLEVGSKLEDLKHVLDNTISAKKEELGRVSDELNAWQIIITKEISIYDTMNKMSYDSTRRALIAEGWVPKSSIGLLRRCLQTVTVKMD